MSNLRNKNIGKFIRVVLIPNVGLSRLSLKIAKEISGLDKTYYILDDKKYLPHITLYNAEYPKEEVDRVYTTIKNFFSDKKSFSLKFLEFRSTKGWVGMEFVRTVQVYNLHKRIVALLNPLRRNFFSEKHRLELREFTNEKRNNEIKYGYDGAMSFYRPHLSLLRYKDPKIGEKAARNYNKKAIHVPSSKVAIAAICESGKNGTVVKIIKKFRLK